MKIEGAIFDLDGTLINSLFFWERLWAKLGKNYLDDPTFLPDLTIQKAVRTITFRDAAQLLYDTFAFGNADEIYNLMHDFCIEIYREEATFKPGAKELLDHLKARGVRMCIASASMPDLLRAIFDRFGLDDYFPKIISCAEVGKGSLQKAQLPFVEHRPDADNSFPRSEYRLLSIKGCRGLLNRADHQNNRANLL